MQEQDLLPLPTGIPELIAITCNTTDSKTKTGTFVVRTRTVVEGVDKQFNEHSLADFVEACGRSPVQWPTSIFIAADEVRGNQSVLRAIATDHAHFAWPVMSAECPT